MYEFKSSSKSRRYELKDIYDHIAEFSGDQHGPRFIQTKLESANSDEKVRVFREIQPNAVQLMTDVFGNYVNLRFFEHGDRTHKKILANNMKGQVLNLSLQMYGCRVVQKALDHVLGDQQQQLILSWRITFSNVSKTRTVTTSSKKRLNDARRTPSTSSSTPSKDRSSI